MAAFETRHTHTFADLIIQLVGSKGGIVNCDEVRLSQTDREGAYVHKLR